MSEKYCKICDTFVPIEDFADASRMCFTCLGRYVDGLASSRVEVLQIDLQEADCPGAANVALIPVKWHEFACLIQEPMKSEEPHH